MSVTPSRESIHDDPAGAALAAVPEPKRARRAALKKQLSDLQVDPEDARQMQSVSESAYFAFKPSNSWHRWLVDQLAVLQVRINRVNRIERRLRDWASFRAIDFWDDDQRLAVETLALRLLDEPARVVAQLHQTPAGCAWLLTRWSILAGLDAANWTEDQKKLASHLLGLAYEPERTLAVDPGAQVARLREHRARVEEADTITRGLVEADLSDNLGPEFTRLRSYERALHGRLRWFVAQVRIELPERWADPRFKPAYAPEFAYVDPVFTAPAEPAVASAPSAETNPPPPAEVEPALDETKPSRPAKSRGTAKRTRTEPVLEPRVAADEVIDGPPRRSRRIDPERALRRQRQTQRRHA